MRATPPHVDVPGDNAERLLAGRFERVRPHIMRRSGECCGMTATQAVWRFGFSRGSESAQAYGVWLDPDVRGFLWVLATRKTGKVLETFQGFAYELPAHFNEVIDG